MAHALGNPELQHNYFNAIFTKGKLLLPASVPFFEDSIIDQLAGRFLLLDRSNAFADNPAKLFAKPEQIYESQHHRSPYLLQRAHGEGLAFVYLLLLL